MSRILVVDDQAILREPIAATLRREGFQTRCAQNGMEALQFVQAECPDLILLDLAMPVLDGLRCLRRLRDDPKTRHIPVIVLSAVADRRMVHAALAVGIQGYLLKSQFSLEVMLAEVQKTLQARKPAEPKLPDAATPECRESPEARDGESRDPLSTRMSRSEVLAQLRKEFELRAVPPVLQHVIALANSDTSSIEEVAEAVQQDPALAIKVLRIANSCFFGSGKIVQTLADAGRRIGMSGVRNAALAILAIERFDSAVGGLNPQHFWEHSLGSAVLAQLIGETIGAEVEGHAFLAALLHDIGRLVLSSKFPTQYKWAVSTAAEQNIDLATPEREAFGLTHVDVTDDLLDRLGLPTVVRQAASLHSCGAEDIKRAAGDSSCALIVALANRMAHALALGDSGSSMLSPVQDHIQALDLNCERVSSIVHEAVQRAQQMKLFYASQGQEELQESLHSQIAQTQRCAAQLTVLNGSAAIDPLEVFFERLGWLDTRAPKMAIVSVANEKELTRRLAELRELECAVGAKLPLLVASPDASVGLPPEEVGGRPWATVPMPGRYQQTVKAVVDLSVANAGSAESGSRRPEKIAQ